MKRVFGPVPSRRLGNSLGVNNIPPKICSYSCVYCQIGRSTKISYERQEFYNPTELADEVARTVEVLLKKNEKIDYISIVPDGEPTLDKNLGKLIDLLKPLGIKIAVITNSSFIHLSEVREDLAKTDWISVKVDTVIEKIWRKIDRPHRKISLDLMLEGLLQFAKNYKGYLTTETMLVKDINDTEDNYCKTSMFISHLEPKVAYLGIPTRPPAEQWVKPISEESLTQAYQIFSEHIENVEYLIGSEGVHFGSTGDIINDILSITAVHPMTEKAVLDLLKKNNTEFSVIDDLLNEGKLKKVVYNNQNFYLRNFGKR